MSVQIFDLTHTFEPFMPQWPSGCNLKMEVKRFHANDGMYNINGRASCTGVLIWMLLCM